MKGLIGMAFTFGNRKKRIIICLCASFAFMLICHGFLMFNPSYSHDSLTEIIRGKGYYQASLGRFLQRSWRWFFSEVTATWFIGCMTAVFIGFAAVLLGDLFRIKRMESLVFLCGILITNHSMISSVATYMPWVDTYGAALLFAVCGVWLLDRYRFGFLPGSLCLVASLGLYPPYLICVPAIVIIQLIVSMQQKGVWKKRLLYTAKAVLMLAIAYGLYKVILSIYLQKVHVAYSERDNSMASIKLFGFRDLPGLLGGTFSLFFSQLFTTVSYMQYAPVLYGLIGISFAVILVLFAVRSRFGVWEAVAMALLLAAIPFVFNIQYIVCEDATYHALMVYSIYFAYILLIPLYDSVAAMEQDGAGTVSVEAPGKTGRIMKMIAGKAKLCVPIILAIILFADIRFANNVYTDKYLRERSTLSVMTRIMGAAEQTSGFDPEKCGVLIIGELNNNKVLASPNSTFYPSLGNATRDISITYDIFPYLRQYMGYSYRFVEGEEKEKLLADEYVQQMPAYPASGFAEIIDDVLVIKISD